MLARRRAGRERIGAEQRAARAPWRHRRRRIAEHERDQAGVERLQDIRGGHAEMSAAPHRDHADAELARDCDRLLHGARADDEAEAVLAVERRRHRGHALGLERRPRIDQSAAHAVEIAGQAGEPMGVDAAQIRAHQAGSDDGGIGVGHAVRHQQAPGEGIRRVGVGIDALGGGRRLALYPTCW